MATLLVGSGGAPRRRVGAPDRADPLPDPPPPQAHEGAEDQAGQKALPALMFGTAGEAFRFLM